jgi:hypothetical protein
VRKFLLLTIAAVTLAAATAASQPNFADARWQTVHIPMFGADGLRVDKLTGDAWYQETVNKKARWVNIPGPLTKAGKRSMSFGENYQVQATGSNVYLIGLRGGDSWRLADNRGMPYWKKIQ